MGGGAKIFEFLAVEDINGNQMNLGVTVFARLGSGHLHNLTRATLDDDESVLPQSRALHWESSGSAGIGRLEGMFMLFRGAGHVSMTRVASGR